MSIPRPIARVNRVFTNRILIHLARIPPFAAVRHVGRRTGREYRIPVNSFRSDGGFVIALTYGLQSDWVKNVMASGGAMLEYAGEDIPLTNPQIVGRRSVRASLPIPVRVFLTLLRVDHCLILTRE